MNSENMTIKIITEEAKEIDASVISIFEIKETSNKYAIYTFNEEDAQGLVKIYASKIAEENGFYTFESISDAAEWTKIKDVMKDTAKETSNYITNGDIVLISAKSIKSKMNEPISVRLSETKAAKIGPNYKTGISNNYLNNVADDDEGTTSVEPAKEEVTKEKPIVQAPEPKVEVPEPTPEVTPVPLSTEPEVSEKEPEVKVDTSAETKKVEEPKVTIEPTPTFELPKIETPEPKIELPKVEVEMPSIPKFENPEPDMTSKIEEKEEYSEPGTREVPNVDSVLNKASYFQNIEEEPKKEEPKENIIQTIGLEFMRKVSELAEYEKDLNKRERDLASRERMLNKIEKEIVNKEERQKSITQANKDKELEIKKKDKELAEREVELNRRILEFNKKISMFQQTFETISTVE